MTWADMTTEERIQAITRLGQNNSTADVARALATTYKVIRGFVRKHGLTPPGRPKAYKPPRPIAPEIDIRHTTWRRAVAGASAQLRNLAKDRGSQ